MWLYSLACVGPGRTPHRPVFSQQDSCLTIVYLQNFIFQMGFLFQNRLYKSLPYFINHVWQRTQILSGPVQQDLPQLKSCLLCFYHLFLCDCFSYGTPLYYISRAMRNQLFANWKTKKHVSCSVTAELISAFPCLLHK